MDSISPTPSSGVQAPMPTMNLTFGFPGLSKVDPSYLAFSGKEQLLIIDGTLTAVSLAVVLTRTYIRTFILKAVGVDDWLMMSAQALNTLSCLCFVNSVFWGVGKHTLAIPFTSFKPMLRWLFFYSICVTLALGLVKISIAYHLLRLTQGIHFKKFLYLMIVMLTLATLAQVLLVIFQCVPVSASWDWALRQPPLGRGNATCVPVDTFNNVNIIMTNLVVITDVIFALLPVPIVWSMSVTTRIKISLTVVLGLGFFACSAGIVKMYHQLGFFSSFDTTGQLGYFIWQITELNLAIIAASLPTIKPLLKWTLKILRLLRPDPGAKTHLLTIGGGSRPAIRRGLNHTATLESFNASLSSYGHDEETFTSTASSHSSPERSRRSVRGSIRSSVRCRLSDIEEEAGDHHAINLEALSKEMGITIKTTKY